MKTVSIAVDDQHINGKLLQPPDADGRRPGVLFVHGWGSSQRRSIGKARPISVAGQINFVRMERKIVIYERFAGL